MNAIESSKQPSAAVDQRPYEPSMEEILASIRRIIADDQSAPARTGREDELNLRASLESVSLPAPQVLQSVLPQSVGPQSVPVEIASGQATSVQASADPADVARPASAGFPSIASRAATAADRAEPVASSAPHAARPEAAKAGSPPPRVVPVTATLGHIAAPQFAMPDRPARPADVPTSEPESRLSDTSPTPERAARRDEPSVEIQTTQTRQATLTKQATETNQATERNQALDTSHDNTPEARSHLFSTRTDQSVTAAFTALAASRVLGDDETLKAMVGDVIRPMLKIWLDDNLPGLVERLVRSEIERVSRGGR